MTRINQYNNRNIKNKFRSKNAIREIYYYQKKTKLLIPKKSFKRLIQEIIQNIQGNFLIILSKRNTTNYEFILFLVDLIFM